MLKLTHFKPLILLFALFLLQNCSLYRAADTISISQPIHDPEEIISSGEKFKLGFFSPDNNSDCRYVGVMMNIPAQTVIWVANRDRPLKDSSGFVTVSEDGNLVVMNGQKEVLWSSNISFPAANSSAQLLDNGNLVLRENSNGRILWESFQVPTDSFMQEMRLGGNTNNNIKLTSWRSPSDPSIGNFSLGIDPLRMPEFFIWNGSKPHWRSGPWNGNVFIGVSEMVSGYQDRFELVSDLESVFFTRSFFNDSANMYYILSSSGVVSENILYTGSGNSMITWTSLKSECDVYGKCGPFGICDPQGSPICTCLPGFQPTDKKEWDRGDWTSGCSRKAMLQCDMRNSSVHDGKPDGFLKFNNVKVPDFADLIEFLKANTEGLCGNLCLQNCSCIAYAYHRGIGCMHWSESLIDIQQFSLDGTDLYIRLASTEIDHAKGKLKRKALTASVVSVGFLLIAISACFVWTCLIKYRGKVSGIGVVLGSIDQPKFEELPLYSFQKLANATDNFDATNKLGEGGFGPVYKGRLLNGQEIAVKRLSSSSTQGIKELTNEVVLISKLQHRNLVRIIGCCFEREEKMLIYEYMPNKSLDVYLFDSQKCDLLDWSRRALIIEGIGRGLLYLHRDSRLKIIHRDLKTSNILLDLELNPRISDFGLARIFGSNQDQANTNRVVGTLGYMAPEYAMGGKFSEKSDVYSFGILLLEIVSGKKNSVFKDENDLSLVGYAWKLWNDNKATKLLYESLFDPKIEMEVLRYIHVGLLCVQEKAKDRPNICTVLSMLNSEISELPPPKLPAYTARLCLSNREFSQLSLNSVNDVTLTSVQGR